MKLKKRRRKGEDLERSANLPFSCWVALTTPLTQKSCKTYREDKATDGIILFINYLFFIECITLHQRYEERHLKE